MTTAADHSNFLYTRKRVMGVGVLTERWCIISMYSFLLASLGKCSDDSYDLVLDFLGPAAPLASVQPLCGAVCETQRWIQKC